MTTSVLIIILNEAINIDREENIRLVYSMCFFCRLQHCLRTRAESGERQFSANSFLCSMIRVVLYYALCHTIEQTFL